MTNNAKTSRWRYPLRLSCGVLLASALAVGSHVHGQVPISVIADTQRGVPGLDLPLQSFRWPPMISGDHIAFVVKTRDGRQAVIQQRAGKLSRCADTSMPIPGGKGTFVEFPSAVMPARGKVAFRAIGADGQDGIYFCAGEQLTRIADTGMRQPGNKINFVDFSRPAFDGRHIVFPGRGTGGLVRSLEQGIYRYDMQSGVLSTVVDWNNWMPGKNRTPVKFIRVLEVSLRGDGGVIAKGCDTYDECGIYRLGDKSASVVADISMVLPNRSGENFTHFDDPYSDITQETDNVVFRGFSGPDNKSAGIYAVIGGKMVTVVDSSMLIPGRAATFVDLIRPNMHRERVFFSAIGTDMRHGIYAWSPASGIVKVIDGTDRIDNKTIVELQISQVAVSASELVFLATFDDGSSGAYRAGLDALGMR